MLVRCEVLESLFGGGLVKSLDVYGFTRLRVAAGDGELLGADTEGLGEEGEDGLIGFAGFGGRGDLDLDGVAVGTDNAVLLGPGDDFDGEHGHVRGS
jgi:hypothetical protein